MLTLVLVALIGATTAFVAEDLPQLDGDLEFGQDTMLWREWRNTATDIDGDGTNDLLDDSLVYFLKDGHYAEKTPYPVSATEPEPIAQLWKRDLYLRYPDRLEVVAWENAAWHKKQVQPVEWPKPDPSFNPRDEEDEPEENEELSVRYSSFLHDIDGDGTPEIALAAEDGFHLYALRGERYEPAGVLKIYPPLRPERRSEYYWRDTDGPARSMSCRLSLSGSTLTAMDYESAGKGQVRFNIARYTLRLGDKEYAAELTAQTTTEPMPEGMEPVTLNKDDVIDFVGVRFDDGRSSAFRNVVRVINASTDGGKTLQSQRTSEIPSWDKSFVDMDGDGDFDMVVQRTGIFDGGLREFLNRMFMDSTLKHRLEVHLQDAQGRFSAEPDFGWEGRLQLDRPPLKHGELFKTFVGEGLVGYGDFNRDGRVDLAIQEHPDRIAIYLATANGFQTKLDTSVATNATTEFVVADVDGDGRSDIVLMDFPAKPAARIYFSREVAP